MVEKTTAEQVLILNEMGLGFWELRAPYEYALLFKETDYFFPDLLLPEKANLVKRMLEAIKWDVARTAYLFSKTFLETRAFKKVIVFGVEGLTAPTDSQWAFIPPLEKMLNSVALKREAWEILKQSF